MEALIHTSPSDYAELVSDYLQGNPAAHSVHLSTVDMAVRGLTTATLISIHTNGNVTGVATRLKDRPLQVAGLPPEAAPATADLMRTADPDVPGVVGPRDRVEAFRAVWSDEGEERVPTFFYRLGTLRPPTVPGTSRQVPGESLLPWWHEFLKDTTDLNAADREDFLRTALTTPCAHLVWEVADEPVAWAATTVPAGGVSRIGPVYTPPEHRGHGYAGAVTAAITRWALTNGACEVVLMTDADDPVPNKVYRRLGFEHVGDWTYWSFR